MVRRDIILTSYREAFGLECKAIHQVREKMGLTNVAVMIPFCRTVEELKKVTWIMSEHGLEKGKAGLELYLMAEIPSNIIDGQGICRTYHWFFHRFQ